ncbi:MAG: hypothetical protein U0640_04580 [Phycisphaerales bacterium]
MRSAEETFFLQDSQAEEGSEGAASTASSETELPYGVAMPDHVIKFPYGDSVTMLVPSADGQLLYVGIHKQSLNIGGVLDHYFHWWTMPLAAIVFLLALRRVVRCVRTRQSQVEEYCQNCNYNLTANKSARCSECGVELAKRPAKAGRKLIRRCCFWLVLGSLCFAFLPVAWWGIPKYSIRWFGSLNVCSQRLYKEAKARGYRMPFGFQHDETVVVAVNPSSGNWARLFAMPRAFERSPLLTPDGKGICVRRYANNGVRVEDVELATGKIRRSVVVEDAYPGMPGENMVVGFSDDGIKAFVQYSKEKTRTSHLASWNTFTGELQEIAVVPSGATANSPFPSPRRFAIVPGNHQVAFVAFSDFSEAYGNDNFHIILLDKDGAVLNKIDLGASVSVWTAPEFSCDGTNMYLFTDHRAGTGLAVEINKYSLDGVLAGSSEPTNSLKTRQGSSSQMRFNADDSLLFIDNQPEILVRDTRRRSWRAFLRLPQQNFAPRFVIPSDDTWVAAAAMRNVGAKDWAHDLILWQVPVKPPGKPQSTP